MIDSASTAAHANALGARCVGLAFAVLFVIVAVSACGGPPPTSGGPDPNAPPPPAPQLDEAYATSYYSIEPPLDWLVTIEKWPDERVERDALGRAQNPDPLRRDTFIRSPEADLEAFAARAQIVIGFTALDLLDWSYAEFDELCYTAVRERASTVEVDQPVQFNLPAGPIAQELALTTQDTTDGERRRHLLYNVPDLDGRGGYFTVAASCKEPYWNRLEPLLRAAMQTFNPRFP